MLWMKRTRRIENWTDEEYYRRVFSPGEAAVTADKFVTTRAAVTSEIDKDKRTAHVIDLGSGFGFQAAHMRSSGYCQVYACDLVRRRITGAREIHGSNGVKYLAGNMQMLPFQAASIDAITISVALHDVAGDALDRVLRECQRVLKLRGRLVLLEPRYLGDIPGALHRWAYRLCTTLADESLHLDTYLKTNVTGRLAESGFELTRKQVVWGSILCIYTFEKTD